MHIHLFIFVYLVTFFSFRIWFINLSFFLCACGNYVFRENRWGHLKEETLLSRTHRSSESNNMRRKKIYGGSLDTNSLKMLKEKRDIFFPLSFVIHNTKPVGHQVPFYLWSPSLSMFVCVYIYIHTYIYMHWIYFYDLLQDLVGLVISVLLLGDFSLVLLTLLQLYSISLVNVFLVLFILPLGILLPFPAGINALFSHGPRRSAGLTRVYALWNVMSLVNVVSRPLHTFCLF